MPDNLSHGGHSGNLQPGDYYKMARNEYGDDSTTFDSTGSADLMTSVFGEEGLLLSRDMVDSCIFDRNIFNSINPHASNVILVLPDTQGWAVEAGF